MKLLDRYILREWSKIFFATVLGGPIVVIVLDITDNMRQYLSRDLSPGDIALAYVFGLPETVYTVLPAAVLFATVFSIGNLGRHSEITATKASGTSFHRLLAPLVAAAMITVGIGLVLAEAIPPAAQRQQELLGERELRSQTTRYNFVYRADAGWVYAVRALDVDTKSIRQAVLEREGTGETYPTLVIQTPRGEYRDSASNWNLKNGRYRIVSDVDRELTFAFDSMIQKSFVETPVDLLAEPKGPNEMRYQELGRYIEALERSGGDGRKLRVERALKIAIPFTCLIITIFAAPLAISNPRASAAFGVALSLGTTILFLTLVRLSIAIGSGGVLPPVWAAWTPNLGFGLVGLFLLRKAPT